MALKEETNERGVKQGRRKKREREEEGIRGGWFAGMQPETKKGIFAVFCFVFAFLFVLSYIGKGGNAGNFLFRILSYLLGRGYFFAPLVFILVGFSLIFSERKKIIGVTFFGALMFLFSSLALLDIIFGNASGGFFGLLLGAPLVRLFDFWASIVIVSGLLTIAFLLMFNVPRWVREWREKSDSGAEESHIEKEIVEPEANSYYAENNVHESGARALLENLYSALRRALERGESLEGREVSYMPQPRESQNSVREMEPFSPIVENGTEAQTGLAAREDEIGIIRKIPKKIAYRKPPLELLQSDRGKPTAGDIRANSNVIKRTFENFGIAVDMGEISIGPTVTQYTLKPAEGVKVSRITALHNDLSLALAAHPIRIEAPIPGRSLVGIEVPNHSVATVGIRTLFEHKLFQESPQPLFFGLGRDVTGNPVFADLAKMPHLLISGATGSGKSVCAHTILTSFLYRNSPELVRFILVDPKRVELSVYNDIPHLLTPVITDAKKTIQALRWATGEMDRRYDKLSALQSRDIVSYNARVAKTGDREILPYIVILIDELADLMSVYPREVESAIIRLAQMARAVGIHLIVATQRPSVDVITGLIKANITARVAFQVASQIDSRTVLDMAGAEKLLGNGDMLFLAGDTAKARRIQGGFISEQEVKRLVAFLREEMDAPQYDDAIFDVRGEDNLGSGGNFSDDEDDDPLYEDARTVVVEAGKASASYLQRRLRVGYARAARLLDILEERGIIGPADGAKPRDILVRRDEFASSQEGNNEI